MRNRPKGARYATYLVALTILGIGLIAGGLFSPQLGSKAYPDVALAAQGQSAGQVNFQNGFAPVVQKVLPAVVNISSTKVVRVHAENNPFLQDPFLRQFFGNQGGRSHRELEESLGSGVVVRADGHILTNNHVVAGAQEVIVYWGGDQEKQMKAKIIGTDPDTDIAVLQVDATNLPTLPFGDSSKVKVGDFALAIGNPFGIGQTTTMGIISATGRGGLGIEDYEDFIQTDAAINPGNSGGALINDQGQLIAINTAILSSSGGGGRQGGNEGIGFAIPINLARHVMDEILKNGRVIRGYLGVVIQGVTPELASAFGLSGVYGALVADVSPDGPAAKAGVERGDIITEINGSRVEDSRNLRLKIANTAPGTTVKLTVFKNGSSKQVSVTLGEMPTSQQKKSRAVSQQEETPLTGVQVDNLTGGILRQLGLPPNTQGVVITDIASTSPAAAAGLQVGDVIQQVNHKPVHSVQEYDAATKGIGMKPVLLLIDRGGTSVFVVVTPAA